MLINQDL